MDYWIGSYSHIFDRAITFKSGSKEHIIDVFKKFIDMLFSSLSGDAEYFYGMCHGKMWIATVNHYFKRIPEISDVEISKEELLNVNYSCFEKKYESIPGGCKHDLSTCV